MHASPRRFSSLALVTALAVAASGCATTSEPAGVPMSPINETASAPKRMMIEEMRYMHGQELLGRMNKLVRMGEDAGPELRAAVRSDDWLVRSSVMWIFGAMGDRRNIASLGEGLKDENESVRLQAASSLVKLGSEAGFPLLVEGLSHSEVDVRFKCFQALKSATRNDFGYRHDAAPEERRTAQARWREWLSSLKVSAL